MASIASQLQSIFAKEKGTNVEALLNEKSKRASILFEPDVASDIDNDEIFRLGAESFLEMCKICPSLIPYEEQFFSEKSKSQQRSFMTEEQNKKLNPKLNDLIILLSAHYLNENALKALEWLIRHYQVHIMNSEVFLGSFLLYHETGLFVKAVSIVDVIGSAGDSMWAFLKSAKAAKSPVTREFLVRRSLEDLRLMDLICQNFRKVESFCSALHEENNANMFSNWISFCSVFFAEAIKIGDDRLALQFFPFIGVLLKSTADQSFTSACLFLLSQLCLKFQIKTEAFSEITSILLAKKKIPSLRLLMILAIMHETQECAASIQDPILKWLSDNRNDLFYFLKRNHTGNFEKIFVESVLSKKEFCPLLESYLAEVSPSYQFSTSFICESNAAPQCMNVLKAFCEDAKNFSGVVKKKTKNLSNTTPVSRLDAFAAVCAIDSRENNSNSMQSFDFLSRFENNQSLFSFLSDAIMSLESIELKKVCIRNIILKLNQLAKSDDRSLNFEDMAVILYFHLVFDDSSLKSLVLDALNAIKCFLMVSDANAAYLKLKSVDNFKLSGDFRQSIDFVQSRSAEIISTPISKAFIADHFYATYSKDLERITSLVLESQNSALILLYHAIFTARNNVDAFFVSFETQALRKVFQFKWNSVAKVVVDNFSASHHAKFFESTPNDFTPFINAIKQNFFDNVFDEQIKAATISFISKMLEDFKSEHLKTLVYDFVLFAMAKDSSLKSQFSHLAIPISLLKQVIDDFCSQDNEFVEPNAKHNQISLYDSRIEEVQGFFELLLYRLKNNILSFDLLFLSALYAGTFESLATTLELQSKASFSLDYCQQLMLSVLIELCKIKHLSEFADTEATRIDILVHCLRSAKNPHNQQQSVLCISELACAFPTKVLDCILPVFTFMGANIMRYDDPFSFYVIQHCIKMVVPVLLNRGKMHYFELLDVFINALEHIPRHRVLKLFKSLLETLSKENEAFPPHYCLKLFCFGYFSKCITSPSTSQNFVEDLIVLFLQYDYATVMMAIESMMRDLVKLDSFPFKSSKPEKVRFYEVFYIKIQQFPKEESIMTFLKEVVQFVLALVRSNEMRINASAAAKQLDQARSDALSGTYQETLPLVETLSNLLESIITLVLKHPKDRGLHDTMQELNMRYLPLGIFVKVITALISHDSILLRKRALQILNEKIQQKDQKHSQASVADFCSMIQPLSLMLLSVSNEDSCQNTSEVLLNTQTALLSVGILCDHFGEQESFRFAAVAESFMPLLAKNKANFEFLAAFFSSFKYFALRLAPKIISILNGYFPIFISFCQFSYSSAENRKMFLPVAIDFLEVSLKNHGPFLSPFLKEICDMLFDICSLGDEKYAFDLGSLLATSIQSRVLLPVLLKHAKITGSQLSKASLNLLFSILGGSFAEASKDIINANLKEINTFYLNIFEKYADCWDCFHVSLFESLGKLVLKMNSALFQPFFGRISDWAFSNPSANLLVYSKILIFMFDSLKEIFAEFFVPYREQIYSVLLPGDATLKSCVEDGIGVWKNLIKCIGLSFKYQFSAAGDASSNGISEDAFDKVQSVLLFQLDNPLPGTRQVFVENCAVALVPAVVDVAKAVGSFVASDPMWKSFNAKLMQFSVAKHSHQKIVLLDIISALFDAFAEEYLGLLPEILPSLAELLEDNDEEVEKRAKECVSVIEKYLGEPILKYLE